MVNDLLILGHGLAGAVLAETALRRGSSVHVFNAEQPGNASTVAAGMVNPLVLRRDVPSWRAAELLPIAEHFHARFDADRKTRTWHPLPLVKLFAAPQEETLWMRAMEDPQRAEFMARRHEPEIDAEGIPAPNGYGTVTRAGWLDVAAFLDAQRLRLTLEGRYSACLVQGTDIERSAGKVTINGISGKWLVHCTGPFANVHGSVPVKGETVTVHIPDLDLTRMVHRGIFLLPLGDRLYRAGSTFKWTDVWEGPTTAAKDQLMGKLRAIVDRPFELRAHWAGVRPASRDRRPILGKTGTHEAVFNGLGARGVLLAPWCAGHLLDHLFHGLPLDPEVDQARFIP